MATTEQQALVENARRAYAAFAAGDMATVGELIAADVVWHVGGKSELAGDYRGTDAVFGFFSKIMELTGGTFHIDVHDILASDEHTAVLCTVHGTRNGKTLEDRAVHITHPDSEGRVREFWGFQEDQAADDAFWE
jgi:ketosteroid isomerase-like protein